MNDVREIAERLRFEARQGEAIDSSLLPDIEALAAHVLRSPEPLGDERLRVATERIAIAVVGRAAWLSEDVDVVVQEIRRLQAELKTARNVCGEAYQLAGAVGAPVVALDNLWAIAQEEDPPHETFLPLVESDFSGIAELQSQITSSALDLKQSLAVGVNWMERAEKAESALQASQQEAERLRKAIKGHIFPYHQDGVNNLRRALLSAPSAPQGDTDTDCMEASLQSAPRPTITDSVYWPEWMATYRHWWIRRLMGTGLREIVDAAQGEQGATPAVEHTDGMRYTVKPLYSLRGKGTRESVDESALLDAIESALDLSPMWTVEVMRIPLDAARNAGKEPGE